MIFSQYRESVYEIKEVLSVHEPTLKVMEFVGQSSGQGAKKGVSQKEQLAVCIVNLRLLKKFSLF